MKPPIPLEEAQARLLALAEPLAVETVPTSEAAGRYLAAPLLAQRTQPPADLSAMDGYAISGPSPWQVIGESKCGTPFTGAIAVGEAIRISTGALMPGGADRVLLQEDAERTGDQVTLESELPEAGKHIRRAGFDFRSGDTLLEAGAKFGPAHIALSLGGGHQTIGLHCQPMVTLIDSGDELVADPAQCLPHQIPASNGAMLSAMAGQITPNTNYIGPVSDKLDALVEAFRQAEDSDLIVTSGGASVGDHDLIRPALEAWGADINFWRVAIKPGKPLLVAQRGQQIILGLPGNPVSSFATAFLFMLPLLRHLSGDKAPLPLRRNRPAGRDLPATGPRRTFVRAFDDGEMVMPISEQDSSGLRGLADSNALIERPEHSPEVKAGTDVPIYPLQNG